MADLSAKEASALGNSLLSWFLWAAHLALTITALAIISAALLPVVGVKLPIRALGFTELAYAMGAYYLYRKA